MSSQNWPLVLVTGASGFIAMHIVAQLLETGKYRVRGTVRDPTDEKKMTNFWKLPGATKESLELVKLDLNGELSSFEAVVEGATYVLHTASPFPLKVPEDENELIKPAVDGTPNMLKASSKEPNIKRVVVTSSVASIYHGLPDKDMFDEKDWSDTTKDIGAYPKSKTLAEKSAWKFHASLPQEFRFELTTINPSFVVGPTYVSSGSSAAAIALMLNRRSPMVPEISFGIVDVRDVARAHLLALNPDSKVDGERFILSNRTLLFSEISAILNQEFHAMGYRPPLTTMPKWFAYLLSPFVPELKAPLKAWGRVVQMNNAKSQEVLGLKEYILVEKSIVEMGHSLIQHGLVPKREGYTSGTRECLTIPPS